MRTLIREGFTLIEVVVGIAVGGIVILTGFTALSTVEARSRHATDATTAALEGATARSALVDWLGGAMLQSSELGAAFEGLDARELGLTADELTFPTRARTPRRVPVTVMRLYIDSDPATRERGLVADLTGALGEEPQRFEVAPAATGFAVRYLPDAGPRQEWAESWVGQPQLPRAVELTLLDSPGEPLPPLLRFPIRIALMTLQ